MGERERGREPVLWPINTTLLSTISHIFNSYFICVRLIEFERERGGESSALGERGGGNVSFQVPPPHLHLKTGHHLILVLKFLGGICFSEKRKLLSFYLVWTDATLLHVPIFPSDVFVVVLLQEAR